MKSKLNRCGVEWIRRSAADLRNSLEPEFVVILCDIILGNETLAGEPTEIEAAVYAQREQLRRYHETLDYLGIKVEYETGREREQLQEVIAKLNAPTPRSVYIVGGPEGEWPPKFTVYNSPDAPPSDETDDTHGERRRLNEAPA